MSLKHGHRSGGKTTYLYKVWENVKQRTTNANHPRFKDWGGRGVTMFAPWRDSFMPFALYVINALGERPSTIHSLDRIDNSLGYVPGNVQWSTAKEQAANRREAIMPQTCWVRFDGRDCLWSMVILPTSRKVAQSCQLSPQPWRVTRTNRRAFRILQRPYAVSSCLKMCCGNDPITVWWPHRSILCKCLILIWWT